jgi:hypothetical protein
VLAAHFRCRAFLRSALTRAAGARALSQRTDAFQDDTLRALCGSLALAQFRMCARRTRALTTLSRHNHPADVAFARAFLPRRVTGLLGDRGWAQDPVPDYSPTTREVPPALGKLVRAFALCSCLALALTLSHHVVGAAVPAHGEAAPPQAGYRSKRRVRCVARRALSCVCQQCA